MSKRSRKRRDKSRPPRNTSATPQALPDAQAAEPELVEVLDALLREQHPLGLLEYASAMLAALEPGVMDVADDDKPTIDQLIASFLEVGMRKTDGLLLALDLLIDDDLLRARLRRPVAARPHTPPGWRRRRARPPRGAAPDS